MNEKLKERYSNSTRAKDYIHYNISKIERNAKENYLKDFTHEQLKKIFFNIIDRVEDNFMDEEAIKESIKTELEKYPPETRDFFRITLKNAFRNDVIFFRAYLYLAQHFNRTNPDDFIEHIDLLVENINVLEQAAMDKKRKGPSNKNWKIGFNCELSEEILVKIYDEMVTRGQIKAVRKDFIAIFRKEPLSGFTKITWLIKNPKGQFNKTALYAFIELMAGNLPYNQKNRDKIKDFFTDQNGNVINISSCPKKQEKQSSLIQNLKPIKSIINSTPTAFHKNK